MASNPADGNSARRYLISAAVTRVIGHPELDVPELAEDVERVEQLFLGELGYLRVPASGLDPKREDFLRAVRSFAKDQDRRDDDYLVLYLGSHGEVVPGSGDYYLLFADTDPEDMTGTALRVDDLIRSLWEDTSLQRILLLLDACYGGVGGDVSIGQALKSRRFQEPVAEPGSTGFVIVTSSRRREESSPGALTTAFARAVRSRATAGNAPQSISLDYVMAAMQVDPDIPPHQRPGWSLADGSSSIPDFLPNPRYIPGADGRRLDEIDELIQLRQREQAARRAELTTHFLPRARGTDAPADDIWRFTGRHAALRDIADWLQPERADERLLMVTGDPGSGKSAVLGLADALSDPRHRGSVPVHELGLPPDAVPLQGSIHVAILASRKSTRQVLDGICVAADVPAQTTGQLIAGLQSRIEPLVVLIDAVDEAIDPLDLVTGLLRPLASARVDVPLRLLLGARRHVVGQLQVPSTIVNLDDDVYADPDAVCAYARSLLAADESLIATRDPGWLAAIAEAVAEAAGNSFLVARITALTIARDAVPPDPFDPAWRADLPKKPGAAMERDLARLGDNALRARDLLLPLAFAQGTGLPWGGFWAPLASAITGKKYTDQDVEWLREHAGSYVVEDVESGGSVYRLYHRALIEYLRTLVDPRDVQVRITRVLRSGVKDWAAAHPYVRRHLALHAAEGGVLDELVGEAAFVLASDPEQLLAALPSLRTDDGRRAGAAIRQIADHLRSRTSPVDDAGSRTRLRFAAVCNGADALAASCDIGEEPLEWRARWAVWNPQARDEEFTLWPFAYDVGVVVPTGSGARLVAGWGLDDVEDWTLREIGTRSISGDNSAHATVKAWCAGKSFGEPIVAAVGTRVKIGSNGSQAEERLLTIWHMNGARRRTFMLGPTTRAGTTHLITQLAVLESRFRKGRHALVLTADGQVTAYALDNASQPPKKRRQGTTSGISPYAADDSDFPVAPPRERLQNVASIIAAPECDYFLIGTRDGRVGAWQPNGPPIAIGDGHTGPIVDACEVAAHHAELMIVTAGRDGAVRTHAFTEIWRSRKLFTVPQRLEGVAVHRVGRKQWIVAAVTSDSVLYRYDLETGRALGPPMTIGRGGDARITACDLGSTPAVVVHGCGRGVQIYDLLTGDRIGGYTETSDVTALCQVAGGASTAAIVCTGTRSGLIRLARTDRAIGSSVVYAHDGSVLALGGVPGPGSRPGGPDKSPAEARADDGSSAGTGDTGIRTASDPKHASPRPNGTATDPAGVRTPQGPNRDPLKPDGTAPGLISVGEDDLVICRDPADGHELWRVDLDEVDRPTWREAVLTCAAVHVGGAGGGGSAFVVVGDAGGVIKTLILRDGVPTLTHVLETGELITAVALGTVRGREIGAAVNRAGEVCMWDLATGRWISRTLPDPGMPWVSALALDSTSGLLAAGDLEGGLHLWSLPSGRRLGRIVRDYESATNSLAFAATPADVDRVLIAGSGSRAITTWRAGPHGLTETTSGVAFPAVSVLIANADGSILCGDDAGSTHRLTRSDDGSWHAESVIEDVAAPSSLALAGPPDDPVVAVGTRGELQVRSAVDGRLLSRHRSVDDAPIASAAHLRSDPTGRSIVTVSGNLVIEDWHLRAPRPGAPFALVASGRRFAEMHRVVVAGDERRFGTKRPEPARFMGLFSLDRPGGVWLAEEQSRISRDGAWVVTVADRRILFAQHSLTLIVSDLDAAYWARGFRLLATDALEVRLLPDAPEPTVVVVCRDSLLLFPLDKVIDAIDNGPPLLRGNRPRYVGPTYQHEHDGFKAEFVVFDPGVAAFAAVDGTRIVIVSVPDGRVRRVVDLESPVRDVALGPDGEIVAATANGVVFIDPA